MVKTHSNFIKLLNTKAGINLYEEYFLIQLFQKYFENKNNNNFYQLDDYMASHFKFGKTTLKKVRKSLITKGLISTRTVTLNGRKVLYYNIKFEEIEKLPLLQQATIDASPAPEVKQEKQITSTPEFENNTFIDNTWNEENIINNNDYVSAPAPADFQDEFNIEEETLNMDDFRRFEQLSLQSDINIPLENKVLKIEEKGCLQRDEQINLNLAFDKDSNNLENTKEDMTTQEKYDSVGILKQLVSGFTTEQLITLKEYQDNENADAFFDASIEKVKEVSYKYNLDLGYCYNKLGDFLSDFNPTPVIERDMTEKPAEVYELDMTEIPDAYWTDLTKMFTQEVKELKKDEWGDETTVTNIYLKPKKVVHTLFNRYLDGMDDCEQQKIRRWARMVYDDLSKDYTECNVPLSNVIND